MQILSLRRKLQLQRAIGTLCDSKVLSSALKTGNSKLNAKCPDTALQLHRREKLRETPMGIAGVKLRYGI